MVMQRVTWRWGAAMGSALVLAGTVVGSQVETAGASARPKSGSPVTIALLAPLTGAYATNGLDNEQGVTLAVDAINAAGGIRGHKVNLVIKDDQTNPTQGVTQFNSIASSNALGMIGPLDNPSASAVAPLAERAGLPMIAPTSDPTILEPIRHYVFETVPVPKYWALPLVSYLHAVGIKRIAIAEDTTENFATGGTSAMAAAAKADGMQVVAEYPFQVTSTDFSPMLTRLGHTSAQAFIAWGGGPAEVQLTKQFAAAGLGKRMKLVFSAPQASVPDYVTPAGSSSEGAIVDGNIGLIAKYLPKDAPFTKQVLALQAAFRKKYHIAQLPQFATDAYASAQVLFAAMKQAKALTRPDIAAALNHLNLLTVDGHYAFTTRNHGQITDLTDIAVAQVQGNTFVPTAWQKKRDAAGDIPKG